MRNSRGIRILCMAVLLLGQGAADSFGVTLSVMPAYNHGRGHDRTLDPAVILFRERMVSALVEHYDCVVLSRAYGLELAREQALAGLQGRQRAAPLLPADWMVRPVLIRGTGTSLVWQLICTRMDGSGKPLRHEAPFSFSRHRNEEIAIQAAHRLAQLLEIAPRAAGSGQTLKSLSARMAVMPAILPRTDSERRLLSATELIEIHLQEYAVTTVERAQFREILGEQALAALADGTERLAGELGALVGADILLRPVIHNRDGDAFSLLAQIIDTRTGALIGVLQRDFTDPRDWVQNAGSFVGGLLNAPVTLPSAPDADTALVDGEATRHVEAVIQITDIASGSGSFALILHAGLEHARAAFALAQHNPDLLTQLRAAIEARLIQNPPALGEAEVSRPETGELTPEYGRGVGELMHEILDRLQALQAATEHEAFYRMRAFFIEGNYREALRFARSPEFVTPWGSTRRVYSEASLLFLLDEWEAAIRILEAAEPLRSGEYWLLANCYRHAQRPRDEMEALRQSGMSHRLTHTGVRFLALMLAHASLDERLDDLELDRDRFLKTSPDFFYYQGRTWEDAGDLGRAFEAYRAGHALVRTLASRSNHLTGGDLLADFRDALARVGVPGAMTAEPQRAVAFHPFPNDLAIYFQPVGEVDLAYVQLVAHRIGWFFGGATRIFRPIPLPLLDDLYSQGRNQFDGIRWIDLMLRTYPVPEDAFHVVFITHEDLYGGGLRFVRSNASPAIGSLVSDYRFRRTHPRSAEDRAEQLSRSILQSFGSNLRRAIPTSLLLEITGSNDWPQSTDCITFSGSSSNTLWSAPSVAFSDPVGRLYAAVTPEALHRRLHDANQRRRGILAARAPFEGEDAYAEAVRDAVSTGPVTLSIPWTRSHPIPPQNLLPGLRFHRFEVEQTRLPDFETLEPVDTRIVEKATAQALPSEGSFACLFEGWIHIPQTGEYGFWLRSTDGSRLSIGDWTFGNDRATLPLTVPALRMLEEGYHPFRLEHFRHRNNPTRELTVRVTRPDLFLQSIPADWLFHEPAP